MFWRKTISAAVNIVEGVKIGRTNIIGNTIDLRSKNAPLASFLVNKAYELVQL